MRTATFGRFFFCFFSSAKNKKKKKLTTNTEVHAVIVQEYYASDCVQGFRNCWVSTDKDLVLCKEDWTL